MSWSPHRHSAFLKGTLSIAGGQAFRVGVQGVYFVLVARALGPREFGSYVGVLAIMAIAAPFASLGSGNLLLKHVVRDPGTFPRYWGKALALTVGSGTVFLVLVTISSQVWLPASVPTALVLTVGAADLLFVRMVDISAMAYQAHHQLPRTALLQVLLSPLRLLGATILIASVAAPSATALGAVYLLTAVVGGIVAVSLVSAELGRPEFTIAYSWPELREGAYFASGLSAQSINNDIDKAMLARIGTLEATGVYGAAYRLVDMAFLPVTSVLVVSYPRFFQHGSRGLGATARYSRPLLGLCALYAFCAAGTLYVAAPVLPFLLGSDYAQGADAVRWLAVLPLLKAFHYFGANALTGAGYQGVRTLILVWIVITNVLLNLWLIPRYSWRGAAMATIASDALLGLLVWTVICYLTRPGRHSQRQGVSSVLKTS